MNQSKGGPNAANHVHIRSLVAGSNGTAALLPAVQGGHVDAGPDMGATRDSIAVGSAGNVASAVRESGAPARTSSCAKDDSPLVISPKTQRALSARGAAALGAAGDIFQARSGKRLEFGEEDYDGLASRGEDADELVIDVDDTDFEEEHGHQGGDAGTKTSEALQGHIRPGSHPVAPFYAAAGSPFPMAVPPSTSPEYASVVERASINSQAALNAVRSSGYPSRAAAPISLGLPTPYQVAPASSPAAARTATPAAPSAAQPPVRSSLPAATHLLPLVAPSPRAPASSPGVSAAAAYMAGAAGNNQVAVSTAPPARYSSLAPATFSSPVATPSPAARMSASAVNASNVHDAAPTQRAHASASSAVVSVPSPRGVPSNTAPVSSIVAAGGGNNPNVAGVARVRVEKPSLSLWGLPALKTEALRQAGSNKTLLYGSAPEHQLRQISNAKRADLIHALDARVKYRIDLGLPPEWVATPVGVTPEKKKQKRDEKVERARKKAGREGGKAPVVTEVQTFTCRMVCLIMQPEFLDLYVKSKGGAGGIARAEQDEGAVGMKHIFYQKLAVAMVTVGWKDSNGNPLSVPDDHKQDDKAPKSLTSRLETLPEEMERSAASLVTELEEGFNGDRPTFLLDLQRRLFGWLKNVRKIHTQFKSNEAQSGGAGADPTEDGGFEEAIHPWQFMGGRLPTMLWEDGCRIFGGGDDFHFTGDAILADDDAGSGSSIPGGPGVRSAASKHRVGAGAGSSPQVTVKAEKKVKKEKAAAARSRVTAEAGELVGMLKSAIGRHVAHLDASSDEDKADACEEKMDKVKRLKKKVAEASDSEEEEEYKSLLERARKDLRKARAEMARQDAADAEAMAASVAVMSRADAHISARAAVPAPTDVRGRDSPVAVAPPAPVARVAGAGTVDMLTKPDG